jgi:hypothetical protein
MTKVFNTIGSVAAVQHQTEAAQSHAEAARLHDQLAQIESQNQAAAAVPAN